MVMIWFQNLSSETMYLSLNVYYMYKWECGERLWWQKKALFFANNIQNILPIMTPNNNHNNNNIPWCKFWYR